MRQNFKLLPTDNFISGQLLNNLIRTTNIPKAIIEETTSELWYETLHGYGTIEFKNNLTYEGNLRYGILDNDDPDNPCTLNFPDGTKYTGTMKNGEITGEGTYTFANGSTYKGEVLNGLRHGKGVFTSLDGIYYEGEWKNGLKHGKGKIKQEGMELEGEWEEGDLKGKCRIKWKSGNVFEGELNDNKMCGNGYMIWFNKLEKYTGQWDNNLQNGFGVHIWYDIKQEMKYFRDRYIGQWKDGKRNGYGKFFYSNGSIYEGYWKNNKKEGYGIFTFQDRTQYVGNFKDDIMIDNLSKEQIASLINPNNSNNTNNNANNVNNNNANTNINPNNNNDVTHTEMKVSSKSSKSNITTFKQKLKKSPSQQTIGDNNNNINSNNNNTLLSNANNTKLIDTHGSSKPLNTIKEKKSRGSVIDNTNNTNLNKEIINEEENANQKALREKKEQISKNIDEIKIPIALVDLISSEPEIKQSLKELDNLLLRNLSLITHLYMVTCGKEDIKSIEIGISTISRSIASDGKSFFSKQLQGMKKDPEASRNKGEELPPASNEEKREKIIELDNVYNNDLYFCLDFKYFWRLIRECGLLTPKLSLAIIDRLYFQNLDNYVEMFFIPELLEKKNKKREEFEKIYDYIYQKIQKSKNIFDNRYKSQIEQNSILLYGAVKQNDSQEYVPKEKIKEDYDLHEEKNIILLRYFYEILIRVAYLRFNDDPKLPIENRVKLLIDVLKSYFRGKRKTSLDNSINASIIIDPKLKNFNTILDLFITNHYAILYKIFTECYAYTCNTYKPYRSYDMTITHKFFYNNIILNTTHLSELFGNKMNYIDLVTIYFKEKKFQGEYTDEEIFEYVEDIFNYEMIFREFCELIFFMSRKYFHFYKIDTEEEDSKGRVLSKEEIEKKKEADRKNKKKRKKTKSESIDIYMPIINDILEAKNIFTQKPKYNPVTKYSYPKLKTHFTIEKLQEIERLRKIEEERKLEDKKRYDKERKAFKEEDINAYKENEQEEKTNSELSDY